MVNAYNDDFVKQKTIFLIGILLTVLLFLPNFSATADAQLDLSKYTKLNAGCGNYNNGQPVCGLENISYVCKDDYTYSMECDDKGCSSNNGLCIGGAKPEASINLSGYRKLGTGCNNWNNGMPGCYGQSSWICKNDSWYIMDCEYKTEGTLALIDPCNIKNGTCHWGPRPKINVDLSTYTKIGSGCNNWGGEQPECFQSNSWICKNDNWYLQKCAQGCYESTNGTCIGGAKQKIVVDLAKYTKIGSGCGTWNDESPECYQDSSWVCKDDYWYKLNCSQNACSLNNGTCIFDSSVSNSVNEISSVTSLSDKCMKFNLISGAKTEGSDVSKASAIISRGIPEVCLYKSGEKYEYIYDDYKASTKELMETSCNANTCIQTPIRCSSSQDIWRKGINPKINVTVGSSKTELGKLAPAIPSLFKSDGTTSLDAKYTFYCY